MHQKLEKDPAHCKMEYKYQLTMTTLREMFVLVLFEGNDCYKQMPNRKYRTEDSLHKHYRRKQFTSSCPEGQIHKSVMCLIQKLINLKT